MAESDILLRMTAIQKRFPGVHALRNVDFDVRRGEIHALVGENGAGKSTLMHILAGVHRPDSGGFAFAGDADVRVANERAAQMIGISMVYQERSLVPALDVAENVFAARQPVNRWGMIRRRRLYDRTRALLETLAMNIPADAVVESLSPARQQQVEIAKALSLDAKLLIFDEPTTSLTESEAACLFEVLRGLKAKGMGIVYISHRLEEVFGIADRITVLKDGGKVGTWAVADLAPDRLIALMIGRDFLKDVYRGDAAAAEPGPVLLEVEDLYAGSRVRGVSFTARTGEVTALAGLNGSGRTETALAVFGASRRVSGSVRFRGRLVEARTPQEAVRAGIGYLPEDRKEAGLFLEMGVTANVAAAHLAASPGFMVREARYRAEAETFCRTLGIAASDLVRRPVQHLSGGNQQKVLLARWLLVKPALLFVDEPTRGIDVGAKREVHLLLRRLAQSGTAVVLISSELPEVLAVADRIVVLHEGRVTGTFNHREASEEIILRHASRSQEHP